MNIKDLKELIELAFGIFMAFGIGFAFALFYKLEKIYYELKEIRKENAEPEEIIKDVIKLMDEAFKARIENKDYKRYLK